MTDSLAGMSSFMIKCSICAQEIEISMMGDHVCAGTLEPTLIEENHAFMSSSNDPESNQPSDSLEPRVPLAKVDTAAANRPFTMKNQELALTPGSAASSSYATLSPFPSTGGSTPHDSHLRNLKVYLLGGQTVEEPEQYGSASPRLENSGSLLQRLDTMALGPLDVTARVSPRTISDGNIDRNTDLKERAKTSQTPTVHRQKIASDGPKSQTAERSGGYGAFGPPPSRNEERPLFKKLDGRSQTFPKEIESRLEGDKARRPSVPINSLTQGPNSKLPAANPPKRPRRPSETAGPDFSRPLPPRGASLIGSRDERWLTEGRSIPGVDLESEFGANNPYHTPSASFSSTVSGASQVSIVSSRSSPPSSPTGSQRKPSSTPSIDQLINEIESSVADSRPREQPPTSKPLQLEIRANEQKSRNLSPIELSPGFRDPAVQGGRQSPTPSRSPSPLQRPSLSNDFRRPGTAKGNCKGCSLPIKGKSVSSADGRLTGRYHKSCFVCNTCREPFATASFYVLDDAPYCERHYHKLNNSMCISCDRGIEGQYLETGSNQKFHAHCFSCTECKRILKHDYFEMNGRFYCERDAFRRAQQRNFLGPGAATNRMERRTTRLMMMMV